MVAQLPQRLKSMLFELFSTFWVPFGHHLFKIFSNNIDFSLWGKQCICPAKMRPKLWKSHIVLLWQDTNLEKPRWSKMCLCYECEFSCPKPCLSEIRGGDILKWRNIVFRNFYDVYFVPKREGNWQEWQETYFVFQIMQCCVKTSAFL